MKWQKMARGKLLQVVADNFYSDKNFYSGGAPRSFASPDLLFSAKDNGVYFPDGEYMLVSSVSAEAPAGVEYKPQEVEYPLIIDTVAPTTVESITIEGNLMEVVPKDDRAGIQYVYVSYEKDGKAVELYKNEDGKYIVPEGAYS